MKFVWTTDPHFDHVPESAWQDWVADVTATSPDGLWITGDISEGEDVVIQLRRVADASNLPVYFVLGNHDFYDSSISRTRRDVVSATRDDRRLVYLTDSQPIELIDNVFLVGEDGWGDATVGDFDHSPIRLRDFEKIEDLTGLTHKNLTKRLRQLGHESAERLANKLAILPATARQITVLTHLPPFREACWYEGRIADDNWAPSFVCGALGQVLLQYNQSHPSVSISVLCGHTHHEGVVQMAENLTVRTGSAVYGKPGIEAVIEIT
ncbi:metallophosphoesterase family protein [Rubripirellula reticaptiva]|uniref:Calcineurin-like phosphoesterase superfamily domain protein n=1 Tax=Rubripirellula reticaptiva TaxID=2528013 RepID=A0A5C6F9F7_9BACT|nr:metallophosphoesterase [Rubripirellula reticaptiva]TWU58018.1 Calcineurin-like phosphoesterase superfamily domain protein [Rubripirellula reticaptiva]